MQLTVLNGTELGVYIKTLFYLTGLSNMGENRHLPSNETSPLAFSWSSFNPTPHPSEPLQVNCYGLLGCIRVKYPVERGFHRFPEPILSIKPTICLQTHLNKECQFVEPDSLMSLSVSHSKHSYWITHGYIDTGHKPWTQKLCDQLLEFDPSGNVYIIDWERAAQPPYSQAVMNIEILGAYIGYLMMEIQQLHGLLTNQTHFIGHSLGAHFGGFVGAWLNERGHRLGRISGLDPAQPYFQDFMPDVRLDPSDAMFVDVIHTDSKPLLSGGSIGGLGTDQPSGHVDFYPNGGKDQPGCKDGMYESILQENGSLLYGIRRFIGCDHIRAYEIFTESIMSPCGFSAFACPNYEEYLAGRCSTPCDPREPTRRNCNWMGFHAKKPRRVLDGIIMQSPFANETTHGVPIYFHNIYYAITGGRDPYCRGQYRLTLEFENKVDEKSLSDMSLYTLSRAGRVMDVFKLQSSQIAKSMSQDFLVAGHVLKENVVGILLKPSVSHPFWWLVNRMVVQHADIPVLSVSILNMESGVKSQFCPFGTTNLLRISEETSGVILHSKSCLLKDTNQQVKHNSSVIAQN